MKQPEQKKIMWVYIAVLFITIMVIWSFFFSQELKKATKNNVLNTKEGLGSILSNFKNSISQGSYLIDQINKDIQSVDLNKEEIQEIPAEEVTADQKEALLDKAKEKIEASLDFYESELE